MIGGMYKLEIDHQIIELLHLARVDAPQTLAYSFLVIQPMQPFFIVVQIER